MVEDNKSFVLLALMLFRKEFARHTTTTVDQVKVMKKLYVPQEKKSFFRHLPKLIKVTAGMEPRAAMQDMNFTGEVTRQANPPTSQFKRKN